MKGCPLLMRGTLGLEANIGKDSLFDRSLGFPLQSSTTWIRTVG